LTAQRVRVVSGDYKFLKDEVTGKKLGAEIKKVLK
jgi:hypothetical protein